MHTSGPALSVPPTHVSRSHQPTHLSGQWGDWLDSLQYDELGELARPWTYWGTLTRADPLTARGWRRAVEGHIERVRPSHAFWGVESGRVNGRLHAHILYGYNLEDDLYGGVVPADKIWDDWYRRHGRAHVDAFEQERGAAHYVSKYVTKDLGDYDLQGKAFS